MDEEQVFEYSDEIEFPRGKKREEMDPNMVLEESFHEELQQHAIIHTDQKPFACDICSKAFRFKSNLFEHRSVHSGFTPHACPYCGKTSELDEAWKPFASNRRPPADIPQDAIIVRSTGEPSSLFTPPADHGRESWAWALTPRFGWRRSREEIFCHALQSTKKCVD
uniref:C2H2-type domain-containing protein n=1 Tax=Ditylenchus dipsaci TaxID=166011 RepID=A0A915D5G8_9BILA